VHTLETRTQQPATRLPSPVAACYQDTHSSQNELNDKNETNTTNLSNLIFLICNKAWAALAVYGGGARTCSKRWRLDF
jgi:hypothetical protein